MMQTISRYTNAEPYLEAAGSYLTQGGARCNLILGLSLRLRNFPERIEQQPYLAVVKDEDGIALTAMMTPPHRLLVDSADDNLPGRVQGALDLLLQDLLMEAWDLPGVRGKREIVSYFTDSRIAAVGGSSRLFREERLYELDSVIQPPEAPGSMRLAVPDDLECVSRWTTALHEFIGEAQDKDAAHKMAEWKIQDRAVYLWEDQGQPVSMSWKNRPTPRIVSVSGVYTPPEARRKGYATALVAHQSQHLLDSGWESCCLFTDLSNPTSNSIYQKIGYRPVCDFDQILFEQTV
jgi:uncharacterized protein